MDILNFPELGGEALMEAFKFMLDRLGHALDRRGAKVADDETAVDSPAVLEGEWRPIAPRPEAIEAELGRLRELAGALSVYERNPDRIDPGDSDLRALLGELRHSLELVYGQHITFQGENRARTGVAVEQSVDIVTGRVTGIAGKQVKSGHVIQGSGHVQEGGWLIGIQADTVGE
ncbi:hypothetical protein GCM10010464_04300 [Pseudonocardia yunnanensis]|uniref:Uncharacterized protein n=1 Tax=Pseudonocardia yunnanensis TaxID=58107 RepID=A0ABW4EVN0_9PSEU